MSDDPFDNWIISGVNHVCEDDKAMFSRLAGWLPRRPESGLSVDGSIIPFHSGPHVVRQLWMAIRIAQPLSVLEIGFNLGHSALLFLEMGVRCVRSIDISTRPETAEAASVLSERYGSDRFSLWTGDSKGMLDSIVKTRERFDLVFIDGAHDIDSVSADVVLGKSLKIQHFLFDDWHPHWGPGVIPAIQHHNLKVDAVLGSMVLCSDTGARWS